MGKFDPSKMTAKEIMALLTRLNVRINAYEEKERAGAVPAGGKVIHRGTFIQRSRTAPPKEMFIDFYLYGEMPKDIDMLELRNICKAYVDMFGK